MKSTNTNFQARVYGSQKTFIALTWKNGESLHSKVIKTENTTKVIATKFPDGKKYIVVLGEKPEKEIEIFEDHLFHRKQCNVQFHERKQAIL